MSNGFNFTTREEGFGSGVEARVTVESRVEDSKRTREAARRLLDAAYKRAVESLGFEVEPPVLVNDAQVAPVTISLIRSSQILATYKVWPTNTMTMDLTRGLDGPVTDIEGLKVSHVCRAASHPA